MWHGIHGHDQVVELFRTALVRNRLASTFLFVGPGGIGKRLFAEKLAQALLCETNTEEQLDPCGHCPACQQVQAHSHPDLDIVQKPKERANIPIEYFIGDRDHRMQEGLCHRISLKPSRGRRKVAIIDDANYLSYLDGATANCLLKTLEEPPPNSVLILIGTSEQRQLPTIRSRSQVIRFQPLADDVVAGLLLKEGVVGDPAAAASLANLSGGSLQRARLIATAGLSEFREQLLQALSAPGFDGVALAQATNEFVNSAAEEQPDDGDREEAEEADDAEEEVSERAKQSKDKVKSALKRERMRQLASFAAEFYRGLASDLSGHAPAADARTSNLLAQARRRWQGDAELALACLERCLEAEGQVDANANQATLIDAWLDDLAELSRGRK